MRIAILGGGIVGVTTAYALVQDGHEVVVVDRQPLAANETSFSNAGMVAPGHAYTWASPRAPKILLKSLWRDDTSLRFRFSTDPRLYSWSLRFLRECNAASAARNTANKLRLCLFSQAQLQDTVSRTGIEFDRVTGGAVYLYRDPALFEAGVRNTKVLTDLGLELRALDPQRAAEVEPALESVKGQLAGAIYSPSDESGDCHAFANKLAAIAKAMGVDFRWNTTIKRIEASGDRIEKVVTDKGEKVPVEMGSHGIGVSRLLGAIIEASHDDKGIIWPEGVTPFPVGIVNLKQGDGAADAACEGLYKALAAKGLEALYDDRDERAGAKFATMDLIGLPWRITVGPRGLANGVVELTSRRTGESEEMSPEAAVDRIAQIYAGR